MSKSLTVRTTLATLVLVPSLLLGCRKESENNTSSTPKPTATSQAAHNEQKKTAEIVTLPPPRHSSDMSVEEAIAKRKSVRHYKNEPLSLQDVSQLLWSTGLNTDAAVDGVSSATRHYPSASATYSFETYLVVGNVQGLESGIYHYDALGHSLVRMKRGDFRHQLTVAILGQRMVEDAPMSLVFAADHTRNKNRSGTRGEVKYLDLLEVGHMGQNVSLQAEALDLGTVVLGSFKDEAVAAIKKLLELENEEPVYIMPVGKEAR